jgi:hypothetical protein
MSWRPSFLRRRRRERDLDDEIAAHLAMAERDRLARHPADPNDALRGE